MTKDAKFVGAVFAIGLFFGLAIGAVLDIGRANAATERAEAAEDSARLLRVRVENDSIAAATRYEQYLALEVVAVAKDDSLRQAERRLEEANRRTEVERREALRKLDSMTVSLSDTAQFVPRATFDASLSALRVTTAALEGEREEKATIAADRDLWRTRYVAADSGWVAERAVCAGLREALAAEIRATEAWKAAARPSWGMKLLGDAKPFAIGLGVGYLVREVVVRK